jgi:3-oxoacyl-(acyl-carrier-protein) synthase
MLTAYREALQELSADSRIRIRDGSRLGVIFASTKGYVDDAMWEKNPALAEDLLSPVLRDFLGAAELRPARELCLSNACASSLSALAIARNWLSEPDIEDVLVLAGDRAGPFVLHGFQSLRATTADASRPFAKNRSGLLLGEATAAIFLSSHPGGFRLGGVGVDAEGFAVTRPDADGESLIRACRQIENLDETPPDLVIAHGTATEVNDPIEARALARLFPSGTVPITGTKGAIGHTLGASGAVDLILAREVMKRKKVFTLSQTAILDPAFTGNFLLSPSADRVSTFPGEFNRVLVTSLGFGGIHAAAVIERSDLENEPNPRSNVPSTPALEKTDAIPFEFPVKNAPEWSKKVERWYQLDAPAFGMAEAAFSYRNDPLPDVIYVASPGGSNATDFEFASGGAKSPALFVHSLPNVRSSAFCQVLGWHGPLFCIQSDPDSFAKAIQEAKRNFRLDGSSVWVVGVLGHQVRRFRISAESP